MLATSGRDWLSRDDALALPHDTWLLEELTEVRDRITDERDVRASGT